MNSGILQIGQVNVESGSDKKSPLSELSKLHNSNKLFDGIPGGERKGDPGVKKVPFGGQVSTSAKCLKKKNEFCSKSSNLLTMGGQNSDFGVIPKYQTKDRHGWGSEGKKIEKKTAKANTDFIFISDIDN